MQPLPWTETIAAESQLRTLLKETRNSLSLICTWREEWCMFSAGFSIPDEFDRWPTVSVWRVWRSEDRGKRADMEAVPRLPMIWFQLKVSPEPTTFGPKLKQVKTSREFLSRFPFISNLSILAPSVCPLFARNVETLIRAARYHGRSLDISASLLSSPSFFLQYIQEFYNDDPESYNNEIHQLESLRSMAVRPPVDMAGCALLKKYYCQLHFLQSRFPMYKEGPAAVRFIWYKILVILYVYLII